MKTLDLELNDFSGTGFILTQNVVLEFDNNSLMGKYDVKGKDVDQQINYFINNCIDDCYSCEVPNEITVDYDEILDLCAIDEKDGFTYSDFFEEWDEETKEQYNDFCEFVSEFLLDDDDSDDDNNNN